MRRLLGPLARGDGQASVEHVGLVLLLALMLTGLATLAAPSWIPAALVRAICAGVGGECRAGAVGEAQTGLTSSQPTELQLVDRYIEADLDDFLAYRASPDRDPRLDWSTDECTAPIVGSTGASFDFTEACLRHDFGYRNYRRLGTFESQKAAVDDRFLDDMHDHCATRPDEEHERCGRWAQIYYEAVHRFGHLVGAMHGQE